MGCGQQRNNGPPVEEISGPHSVLLFKFQREMPGRTRSHFDGHPLGRASLRTSPKRPGEWLAQ